jgi:ribose transport system permease protein
MSAEATTPAEQEQPALRRALTFLADHPELALVVVLLALMVVTHLVSENGFFRLAQLSTTLQIAGPLAVIAAGQTLVMLTAGIDLSVANTATAAGFIMADQGHEGTARAIVVGFGVGFAVGLVNGIGVAIFRVNPLIMTLGTATIVLGLITLYASKFATGAPLVPHLVNQIGGDRVLTYLPLNVLVWVPLAVVIILMLRSSGLGRMLYAVGDNPRACRLAGVRVWQVQLTTYVLCGLLSALAGMMLAGYTGNVDTQLASEYLLPSVAAVVIGGTSIFGGVGGYLGTVLGALILTVLNALLTLLNTREELKQVLYGLIILVLASAYAALSRAR